LCGVEAGLALAAVSTERPLILIANDDGVTARGLLALRDAMVPLGDVVVCAPEREQSANSHSLTLANPLRHRDVDENVHAVDGTPADCIYVALFHQRILPRAPDLVLSGINHGPNLGADVFYSGTVAAAREAALRGIRAIAFSLERGGDLELAARLARAMAEKVLGATPPPGQTVLLNVNFPAGEIAGVRATRLGRRLYDDAVTARTDPRGREYFWIGGPNARHEPLEGSDTEALDEGYASVTPLLLDATCPAHMGMAAFVAAVETEGGRR